MNYLTERKPEKTQESPGNSSKIRNSRKKRNELFSMKSIDILPDIHHDFKQVSKSTYYESVRQQIYKSARPMERGL